MQPRISSLSQPFSVELLDHHTLLQNRTYQDLFHKCLSLEAKLETSQQTLEMLMASIRSGPGPTRPPAVVGPSTTQSLGTQASSYAPESGADNLAVHASHPLLQPLLQRDYPNVNYWHRQDWKPKSEVTQVNNDTVIRGKTQMANGVNVQYRFLEDEDGTVQNGWRVQKILTLMREIWREFECRKRAPSSWKYIPASLNNYFRATVYQQFAELRYCEGHWKIEYIATHSYSGWKGDKLPPPSLNKAKKGDAKTKVATSDGSYMHVPQKRSSMHLASGQKNAKKFKVPVVPINAMPSTSSSNNCCDASTPTLSTTSDESAFSLPSPPSISQELLSPESGSEIFPDSFDSIGSSTSESSSVAMTLAVLHQPLSCTTPAVDKGISVSAPSTGDQVARSLQDLLLKFAGPTNTPPAANSASTPLDTHIPAPIPSASDDIPPVTRSISESIASTVTTIPAFSQTNPSPLTTTAITVASTESSNNTAIPSQPEVISLTQSSVPPPSAPTNVVTSSGAASTSILDPLAMASEVIATTPILSQTLKESVTDSTSLTSNGKTKAKGKGKADPTMVQMVPGKAITPRNLFATDYCKTDPTISKAAFDELWKNTNQETKQRYKVLAAKAKAEVEEAKAKAMGA